MQQALFYVGTYTQRGSQGIYTGALDLTTGAVSITGSAADPFNPSFVVMHPNGRFLYAVNETEQGAVAAYAADPATGGLTLLNRQPSQGAHPCHLSIADGHLLVANYSGGTIAALPIRGDGSLGKPSSMVRHSGAGPTERQQGSHPHMILPGPTGQWLYVPDLGLDQVLLYKLQDGKLEPGAAVGVTPGAGPRHLTFDQAGRFAYLINELDSTVIAFRVDSATGALDPLQTVPTLPAGATGKNWPAGILLHPTGRFLYASNREQDSIALFLVDPTNGRLTPAGHFPSGGRWPRGFAIDPTGRFLLAAHQHGDSIVSFAIEPETGALTPTGHEAQVPAPVCIAFR
jgi:6-phosphogluconolactonase